MGQMSHRLYSPDGQFSLFHCPSVEEGGDELRPSEYLGSCSSFFLRYWFGALEILASFVAPWSSREPEKPTGFSISDLRFVVLRNGPPSWRVAEVRGHVAQQSNPPLFIPHHVCVLRRQGASRERAGRRKGMMLSLSLLDNS